MLVFHPEERDWIEDVKQWAKSFLASNASVKTMYGVFEPAQFLAFLSHGGEMPAVIGNLFNEQHWLGVVKPMPLSWTEHGAAYVLIESHRAAIYSVLKAWRKEQEGV